MRGGLRNILRQAPLDLQLSNIDSYLIEKESEENYDKGSELKTHILI
jgi:hypothetical protein